RKTQELMDSVAIGNKAPFQKYYAEDPLVFDEKGRKMDKTALVKDVEPLPKGYTGSIRVMNPESRIFPSTAILSYDEDETETIYGQDLHARYHETDPWMLRADQWQIVAAQVLRYYEDPAIGRADTARFADYVGTYELAPDITLVVSAENGRLYSQPG